VKVRRILSSGLLALILTAHPAGAQEMTVEQAREEGKAMAQQKRNDPSLVPSSDEQAQAVPGFTGTSLPQSIYFDDPDRLVADAQASKAGNESYRIVTDADRVRPTFSNAEILATTSRATQVENDPTAFLDGEDISAGSGTCTPLPPGIGTEGYYEATCNTGTKLTEEPRTCTIRMVPQITNSERWFYYGVKANLAGYGFADLNYLNAKSVAGVCRSTGVSKHICDAQMDLGAGGDDPAAYLRFCKRRLSGTATQFSCAAELPQGELPYHYNHATGTVFLKKEGEVSVTVSRDDSSCAGLASDELCRRSSDDDVCVEGAETRTFEGVPITQACWAWQRNHMCHTLSRGNDCTDLENNRQCTHLRDTCLDDPQSGPCKVVEKVYKCPTPGSTVPGDKQYICGSDVYCINGDCEPIVREASTEFRDALVGLHSLDQAGKEFNEADYRVFSGKRETCHKPVFGLINCCAGKVSGVVPVAAGAAALAGGPAAIAAFATPFLTLFACSQDEMKLDIKDRMGFCHNLGSYCSSSFLGICKTRRTAYCCFESKLSRILQEQGRVQLGKPWGPPKREQCQGFAVEEFAQLDLSLMDFTEVYSDFMEAAKLPDEVQTLSDIQDKIQAYYDLHGN
jgi:conjugal transfer mating pair stabilization protein TraN